MQKYKKKSKFKQKYSIFLSRHRVFLHIFGIMTSYKDNEASTLSVAPCCDMTYAPAFFEADDM